MTPLAVHHLELLKEPLALPPVAPGHGLLLVLWAGALPVGQLRLDAEALPISPQQLREGISRAVAPVVGQRLSLGGFDPPLPELRPSRPPSPPTPASTVGAIRGPLQQIRRGPASSALTVSVVVCTRDRPEPLERALRSLTALTPAPDEVLVVDNAPTGSQTRDVVLRCPDVRYVLEPRPGLSAARNAGLRAAGGEVVAFTDDDVTVHPAWVGRLREAFDGSDALAVTGLVLPAALDTEGQLLFELHMGGFGHEYRTRLFDERWFQGVRHLGAPVWRIGAGANMAFRRQAFELVGGFDERLGAGAAGCSEDSEMWYRVLAAGHSCLYEPAAVVHHHHRSDADAVRLQSRAYLDGHVAALIVQYAAHRDVGSLRRALVGLPRYYVGRLARSVRRPDPTLAHELRGLVSGLRRAPGLVRRTHGTAVRAGGDERSVRREERSA